MNRGTKKQIGKVKKLFLCKFGVITLGGRNFVAHQTSGVPYTGHIQELSEVQSFKKVTISMF